MQFEKEEIQALSEVESSVLSSAKESLLPGLAIFKHTIQYSKNGLKIQILLDKFDDPFGSPNIEDCEQFSRLFQIKLSAKAEEMRLPSDFSLEVSSPGAERQVHFPEELQRFKLQPMSVQFVNQEDKIEKRILKLDDFNEETTYWFIADVKVNRLNKIINKKNKQEKIEIKLKNIQKINLYLDF